VSDLLRGLYPPVQVCKRILKCFVRIRGLIRYCSLDCRHVCCGPCLAGWFTSQGDTTCPECRVESRGQPQRDFALRDVLSLIYEGQGRDVPGILSENFDPSIFATIYAEKEERGRRARERRERLQQVINDATSQPQNLQAPANRIPDVIIDVEMQDDGGSDWELGSGVDSEEGEGVATEEL
jgi:hypothetical protein